MSVERFTGWLRPLRVPCVRSSGSRAEVPGECAAFAGGVEIGQPAAVALSRFRPFGRPMPGQHRSVVTHPGISASLPSRRGAAWSRACLLGRVDQVAVRVRRRPRSRRSGRSPFMALPFMVLPFTVLPFRALPFRALPFVALPFRALPFRLLFASWPFVPLPGPSHCGDMGRPVIAGRAGR